MSNVFQGRYTQIIITTSGRQVNHKTLLRRSPRRTSRAPPRPSAADEMRASACPYCSNCFWLYRFSLFVLASKSVQRRLCAAFGTEDRRVQVNRDKVIPLLSPSFSRRRVVALRAPTFHENTSLRDAFRSEKPPKNMLFLLGKIPSFAPKWMDGTPMPPFFTTQKPHFCHLEKYFLKTQHLCIFLVFLENIK